MGVLVVMVIGMGSFCGREAADEVRCSGEEEQEEHSNTHLSHMVVQDFFDCL